MLRFHSSGMWHCVTGQLVPNTLKERSDFVLKVKQCNPMSHSRRQVRCDNFTSHVMFIYTATTSITITYNFQCPADTSEEGDVATPTQCTNGRHNDIRFTDGYVQKHDAKGGAQCQQHVGPFGCNVLGTMNSCTRTWIIWSCHTQ
jgi:hypothetical protein